MGPEEPTDCPVCGEPVYAERSHVMLCRVDEEPLFFHETCLTFGVLFGRTEPLGALGR